MANLSAAAVNRRSVWVFVRVIDNFGDIGVAWRLAQAWARAFQATVHLWVDDVAALTALVPLSEQADCSAVKVHGWGCDEQVATDVAALAPPQWVVETFGCHLPTPVLGRLACDRPLWLNWEYLSAEDWARAVHGLPSLQGNGVAKYFWLMGFDEASGGLLCEPDYAAQQQTFAQDKAGQQAFCRQYGLPETHQGRLWLVFAYASAVWAGWLDMWLAAGDTMTVWLAGHQVVDSLRDAERLPADALRHDGDVWQVGKVTLVRIPFVPQSAFDRLLWLADGVVMRGEDSFVRAQWAGLPFFWHIYAQAQNAHVVKLHAFWHQAMRHWSPILQAAFSALSDDMNGACVLSASARLAAWQVLQQAWPQWQAVARQWTATLAAQPTAMERLARFCQDKLE